MKKQIIVIAVSLAVFSKAQKTNPKIPGSDRDKHGCIASAGYTYSVLKKECIRPFEQKILLKEIDPKESYTSNAAVVLSNDTNSAELFLPTSTKSIILVKTLSYKNTEIYKKGKIILVKENNKYTLKKAKKIIYST